MTEKNYIDAHFHFLQTLKNEGSENFLYGATCCHSKSEFLESEKLLSVLPSKIKLCFGLHPQMKNPFQKENQIFLLELLEKNKIAAIGECGFDFFNDDFKSNLKEQDEAFAFCLDCAIKYKKPLVIHNRKALEKIYEYASLLKNVPSALFHGFAFGPFEAESILKKGINAYFSFGKALQRKSKKSITCVKELPLERLLLETDAPFMTLKGEPFTKRSDIKNVYAEFFSLRNVAKEKADDVFFIFEKNFKNIFGDD